MRVGKISALILLVWPALAGDITVSVHITRRLTRKAVVPTVYDLRGATAAPAPGTPDAGINEFARTVVLLAGKTSAPITPETITIEQVNMRFEPDLAIIPVGSTVQFPNGDPIFHNVFSLSRTQQFDLGFYKKGQTKSVTFEHPGVVQIYCHIHPDMYAAIVVTENPWYGRPTDDGTVVLKGIPAGHYRVEAWHKVAGLYGAEVDVPATGAAHVDIQIPLSAERKP